MKCDRLSRAVLLGATLVHAFLCYRTGRFLIELGRHGAPETTSRPIAVVLLLLVTVMAALIAALCRPPTLRANLALAVLSASAATYAVERAGPARDGRSSPAREAAGDRADARSPFRCISRHHPGRSCGRSTRAVRRSPGGHYSPERYRVAALAILAALAKSGVL